MANTFDVVLHEENDIRVRIHWMSWENMCRSKDEGGLGFRLLLYDFNLALLAKQGWRLVQNPDSLASWLLKAKYFPHNTFWHASLGYSPSVCWKGILEA